MRLFSFLLIIAGVLLLGFGGYQYFQMEKSQSESLAKAKERIESNRDVKREDIDEPFQAETGEEVGILHIPKLESDLPIIEGTDEDELAKGVGHYAGTAYPSENDQIVLSGHRDTVFRRMGELELGDLLTVQMPYGDFSYEIVETKIVDADDLTIIVPTAPDEVLTVSTCYPFTFVGSAPDRYIITAIPVDQNE